MRNTSATGEIPRKRLQNYRNQRERTEKQKKKAKKKVKQIIAKAVAKWKLYAVAVAVVVVSAGAESIALEREKLLCCAMNNAENLQIFKERFFSSQLRLRSLTCVCKYVCHLNVIKSIFA